MARIASGFDPVYLAEAQSVYRLCFLLARRPGAARRLTFEAFLRLGAAQDTQTEDPAQARALLYGAAVRLCDDYYLQKPRRLPPRVRLEEAELPFAVTDALWALLREPFARRAMAGLCAAGFDEAEAYRLLRRARRLPARRLSPTEEQLAACANVCLSQEETLAVSDEVYARFAERSVGVENAIHGAKSAFDRALPLLAALAVAVAALALWMTR